MINAPPPATVIGNDSADVTAEDDAASYHRYQDSDNDNDNDDVNDDDDDYDSNVHHQETSCACCATPSCSYSCYTILTFQDRYLAPASPERASGSWMLINTFMLVWSLSLGAYITLLYWYYNDQEDNINNSNNNNGDNSDNGDNNNNQKNNNAASRESTTDYLIWSLMTTLVWMVEISLRAAFPAVDTVLVVKNKNADEEDDDEDEEEGEESPSPSREDDVRDDMEDNHNRSYYDYRRTYTAEESVRSVVTVEKIVQRRSKKQSAVIIIELLLAVYFGVETIFDCWRHWHSRHGDNDNYNNDDDATYYDPYDKYYDYDYATANGGNIYSMLEQESDVWINVLAYAYMTYETYQAYYRFTTTKRDIQRSLSQTHLHRNNRRTASSSFVNTIGNEGANGYGGVKIILPSSSRLRKKQKRNETADLRVVTMTLTNSTLEQNLVMDGDGDGNGDEIVDHIGLDIHDQVTATTNINDHRNTATTDDNEDDVAAAGSGDTIPTVQVAV